MSLNGICFNSVFRPIPNINLKLIFIYINNKRIPPQTRGRYNFCNNFDKALKTYLLQLRSDSSSKAYKLFCDYRDAVKWGNKWYREWKSSLNKNEIHHLEYYVGNVYKPLNRYLRTGQTDFGESYDAIIKDIDNALNRATIAQNIILFRWLGYNGFYELSSYKDIFEGNVFTEKGFMSTSINIEESLANTPDERLALLIIRVPKGTTGAYIDSTELEIILSRGQKLRIAEIVYFKDDGAIFLCDIVF